MLQQISPSVASGPIYDDGTYLYFGEANPGTPLNVAKWRVSRMHKITKQIEWAAVNNSKAPFTNLFTNVGIAAALLYS